MKTREKILAIGFGAILLVYGGKWLLESIVTGPLEARGEKTAKLQKEIDDRKVDLRRASKAAAELKVWQARSLPADAEVARSLYQAWLLELVGRVGLASPNVDSGEAVNRKGMYQALAFSVRGRGTLEQLTRFLFEFYSAGHLQQIQSLAITPLAKQDELDLVITIEALVLPAADRKDRLSTRRQSPLASANLADYQSIVQRNLFSVGGGNADAADHTYLTAVIEVDGQSEAWFTSRVTDKILKLRKGESLDIGEFRGTVAEIDDADVIIESEDERWLITIGENLAQASTLPPER